MPTSVDQLSASHVLSRLSSVSNPLKRAWTPVMSDAGSLDHHDVDSEAAERDSARQARMRAHFERAEKKLFTLFQTPSEHLITPPRDEILPDRDGDSAQDHPPRPVIPATKARVIDDDYGDDDDDEDDISDKDSPLRGRSGTAPYVNGDTVPPRSHPYTTKPPTPSRTTKPAVPTTDQGKTSEDARKNLEEQKKAAEASARESFRTIFYTLETDRDAMLEQQKLDELDRQVETELAGQDGNNNNSSALNAAGPQQGSLSSANLGSSSLTFKHLISRIDSKRNQVKASDAQLRSLMSDVRKNRSRWASVDQIGQEELYESLEKVLLELKSMTEYAGPFLQKVNKREAPDYYNIITKPMDFSTMLRKLNQHLYKSKREFVDDLSLIWSNCLKYNAEPTHFLRKKALHMRKETEKLVPLIPDIVVRDRAEVEAEDRRLQQAENEEGAEDSDDEEPIMASRGRKAPSKKSKKSGQTSRKATSANEVPSSDPKPVPGVLNHVKSDADSMLDGSLHGFSTPPPPGVLTPLNINGSVAPGSHADPGELDGGSSIINGVLGSTEEIGEEDQEFKTWKHVTKKDRAHAAAERHRMFQGDHLNLEEPALLRSKASMRRWMRQQKPTEEEQTAGEQGNADNEGTTTQAPQNTTLAEGIDGEDDRNLPDYYDPTSAIPTLDERLAWNEDFEGQVIDPKEEFLRLVSRDVFKPPQSTLANRIESNNRQLQETRKVVARIGIVKQMQLQTQVYQNQFQKYEPERFVDPDVTGVVVSEDGPIMSRHVCRAALQKAVGKLFYHAGFEEFQPSALETVTDIASDYFTKLVHTLGVYAEAPKIFDRPVGTLSEPSAPLGAMDNPLSRPARILVPRFSKEECILHTLNEGGTDLDALESYVKEDVERQAGKLEVQHNRLKDHLAELLRPALDPSIVNTAADSSVNAFNDGSEQFIGGDILAEDLEEDFFGFKELGLDKEFGLASLSVPLHLLQSRVRNAYQPANATAASNNGLIMGELGRWPHITRETLVKEIGLIQNFFLDKLEASENDALIEDDELPTKARFPKPRLPPTGKITSPRKRPIREQQMLARKKRKMEREEEREAERAAEAGGETTSHGDRDAAADDSSHANGTTQTNGVDTGAGTGAGASTSSSQQQHQQQQQQQSNGIITSETVPVADAISAALDDFDDKSDTEVPLKAIAKPISKIRLDKPVLTTDPRGHGDPEKGKKNGGGIAGASSDGSGTGSGGGGGGGAGSAGGSNGNDNAADAESATGMLSPESLPIAVN